MKNTKIAYAIQNHMFLNKFKPFKIVVDSREKNILPLPNYSISKLDVGDYSIKGLEDKICVERKSLIDLFGTLGQGNVRFKNELERAKGLDYFAILVEGNFKDILNRSFVGCEFSKMPEDVVIKILCTLSVKYGIPIFYCSDSVYSAYKLVYLFNSFLSVRGLSV